MTSQFLEQPIGSFGVVLEFSSELRLDQVNRSEIMDKIDSEGLVVLRGVKCPTSDEFMDFGRNQQSTTEAFVHWDFGPLMELKVDSSKPNYLFSNESVPFHWDGAFHEEPSVLMFHCLEAPSREAGGETIFANMESVYEDLTLQEKTEIAGIELTYQTEKLAHYGGAVTVNMLQTHPRTKKPIIRYAEPVKTELNPVTLSINGSPFVQYEIEERMKELLYSPKHSYTHSWRDGDILLADNHQLVHGRNAFSASTSRHIRRVQLRNFA